MRTRAVRSSSRRQKNSVRHAIAETRQESAPDHVLHLQRLRAYDPGRARGYVLQLQRQYGNQYVQRVIDTSKGGPAAQVQPFNLGGMMGGAMNAAGQAVGAASGALDPVAAFEKVLIMAEVPVEEMKTILLKLNMTLADLAKDPMAFISNLLKALKTGFGEFFGNIREHVVNGMVEWMGNSLEDAGIQMPDDFDLKGIFMISAQVLSITGGNVREKLGNVLGGTPTAFVEQVWGRMSGIANQGPAGIWELCKGQLTPVVRSLREALLEFAVSQPLTKGMEWMGEALNPAGGMVMAVKAIYQALKFVYDLSMGIGDKLLVPYWNAIRAAVTDGGGSAVAMLVEVLKKSTGAVINLFQHLLGLGEIDDKIKEIIMRFRSLIEAAIERSLSGVKHTYRHLLDRMPH